VVDDDDVVRVNSNLVPVPASVIDTQGKAVTNLSVKDFELRVDGEVRPIGDISRAETPVRMAVLFDNSQSMAPAREFEKLAAIRFFRRVMRPIDQASLYAISTEPTLIRPLTNDVPALVRAIERFPNPEGATSFFDALIQASEYLRPHHGRKVIIAVTDGVETTSQVDSFDETLRRMLAADCQFFAVQTGHSDNANLRNLVAERRLQEFAAQTGGAVYAPKSIPDLDNAFAHVAADLAEQYVLSYYPANERRDGRFHIFSLRVVTQPNVRVRTRRGYYSPKG
jgi:Ca-activated chloride channel family protein